MNIRIKRRTLVRTVVFSLSALTVAIVFALVGWNGYRTEKQKNEYNFQRSVLSLTESIDSIDVTLKKTLYAGSAEQFASLAAKLCTEAAAAKSELGQIPASAGELNNINRFISQVGDYSVALANKRYLDEDLTDDELKKLRELEKYTSKLKLTLNEIMARGIDSGSFATEEAKEAGSLQTSGSSSVMAEDFTDYPTLIYDGPFSDHIYDKKPELIKNSAKISREEGLKKAQGFSNNDSIEYARQVEGNLPMYVYSGDNIEVGVSVQGGQAVYMINGRNVSRSSIDDDDAEKIAAKYLREHGYENMESHYYEIYSNCCVVNFTSVKDNVVMYPDLVKVTVALDNGEVVEFDARDYVMNHHDRSIAEPRQTKQQASKIVSRQLDIENSQLAVIPADSTNETLCWEFLCEGEEDTEVLIYINAENLKEEKILLIVENENGKLTI